METSVDPPTAKQAETNVDVQDNHRSQIAQQGQGCASIASRSEEPHHGAPSPKSSPPKVEKRFTGVSLDEIMVVEIFAGTARLTRA